MKRRKLLFVGIAGFVFLIVVGIGGLAFWGWNLFADQAKVALNKNSVIRQYIGQIEQIEVDLIATGNEEGEDVFVFRIEGPKGTGVVTAEFVTIDADAEEIRSGSLQLPTGETYDLLAENLPSHDDDAIR